MLVFQALFPQKPSISEERVKLCVLCTYGHGRVYTQEVPFAQPAQGEPSLGHPQSCLLLIWYLGMLKVSVERKNCMVDKEELGVLCWEYLGDIQYISMKKQEVFIF